MTIKEVELHTGLARANIRYYEEQGFFSPARGENGYRSYSDEDIDTLLKIKLLRQLGFSLEEIHELQRGERSLEPALERREADLERLRQELGQAAQLCRDMRADGVSFYTLDARRYLNQLAQAGEVLAKDQDPVRIFPWRRYFARTLDLALYHALIVFALQMTTRMNFIRVSESGGSGFLLSLTALLAMFGAETVMLHVWGTTPGKALLGLKILREDGSRLGLDEAAQRTAYVVLYFGFAYGLIQSKVLLLLLAGAAMLIWACWQVYHENPLFWEEDQLYLDGSTRERGFWEGRRGWLRIAGYLAAWAACIGLMVAGHLLASMPPHRGGSITVEQFVENYNRFMEFSYGKENLRYCLTEQGCFQKIPEPSGTVVIDILGESPVPQASFQFTQEDGVLTEVRLVRSYESRGAITEKQTYAVGLPYEEIAVAARSFLWKPLGNDGVAELYKQLAEEKGNLFRDLGGGQIDSKMSFSGYRYFGDVGLIAQEGQSQSYFVECTMRNFT